MEQLYFEEVLYNLFVSKTCIECEYNCKILCISKDAKVLCSKYKKSYK